MSQQDQHAVLSFFPFFPSPPPFRGLPPKVVMAITEDEADQLRQAPFSPPFFLSPPSFPLPSDI